MIKKIFAAVIIVLVSNFLSAQLNSKCYILYQNIKDKSWSYPHWFENDKQTFTGFHTVHSLKDFPVLLPDGKIIHSTDTITYKKEYIEMKNYLNRKKENDSDPISVRELNSNVVRRHNYFNQKKYLVIDTLAEMSNWQITQDTVSILGFLCQKATTIYKGKIAIAFFATKLPFPAGPRSYRGLPGLILSVTNEAGIEGYTAIELQYPYKSKIPLLETDGIAISQKEYQILVDKSNADVFKNLSNIMANPSQLIKN